jgi:hypothetical protein
MKKGDVLHFRPTELKHNLQPNDMVVAYQGGVLCPLTRLQRLLVQSFMQGQPITGYLCRPLTANKQSFEESNLTVSAFEEDVALHFSAAGVPYHATLHGSRRGSLQEVYQQDQSLEAVGERGQIKTQRVRELYVNPKGHLPCRLPKGPRPLKKRKAA